MSLQHVLQFVGGNLDKSEIGQILKNMPYLDVDGAFDDLLLSQENATNDILALDRGVYPRTNKYDDHPYHIKRLINRKRKADFQFLPPQVQQAYEQKFRSMSRPKR